MEKQDLSDEEEEEGVVEEVPEGEVEEKEPEEEFEVCYLKLEQRET